MARGGYRPGSGRKKLKAEKMADAGIPVTEQIQSVTPESRTPLQYMLDVMNDPSADEKMRAQMAIAAAPYCHARIIAAGKKDAKDAAARASSGGISRFAAQQGPRLTVVSNGTQ